MKIFKKIFGDPNEKIVKNMQVFVDEINSLEEKFQKMNDTELKGMTDILKKKLQAKEEGKSIGKQTDSSIYNSNFSLDEILAEAFAVVREMAKRKLGMRHYDVQLMGGLVLHRGQIAEMKTGEGKTLVATLPVYLNALTGQGVHVITVNDYLARRDAGWMAPVYCGLGMSVGVIVHDAAFVYDPDHKDESEKDERLAHFRKVERQEAYLCDITYGTNNEFGFDYLRDNMVSDSDKMVQRGLNYTIVDEIDSILIDEARTPLIISAPAEESTDKYFQFAALVKNLKENTAATDDSKKENQIQGDYNIDEKMRAVTLTEAGIAKMEKALGVENIYVTGGIREVHHIEQALKALVLFKKDRDYVVKGGQVIIVDEFTGRMMPGRRYSEGLHQAIEAKEGLEVKRESQTFATITFQNYFRMYGKLSGMTGTALTEAEEFAKIYSLETVSIPTNRPLARQDLNDLIYRTEEGKFRAVIQDVKKRSKSGQPSLVGTISIEKNEILAGMMEREGLHPQILNAKNHAKEAQIISQAGLPGAITIATNMAGRGVDIVLGGPDASEEEQKKVKKAGGLHVIGTERHESRRIDNQLRGRSGRQGDPGSTQFYVSTQDDLMRIFGGDRMQSLMATLKVPEDMPIDNKLISRSIESAQKKVEGNNFDIRKHLVEYDDVINKHREAIYRKRKEILTIGALNKNLEKSNTQAEIKDEDSKVDALETEKKTLKNIILEMVEAEIEQVVSFHTAGEDVKDWNLDEIYQVVATIFPVNGGLKESLEEFAQTDHKLDKAKARTKIIENLLSRAKKIYQEIDDKFQENDMDWTQIEKGILIRSIDTLWVEHLEAMSHMRQGIGLRGYGQRDPLIEYKKEAYQLYNELNSLIQKQVVYSIFKVAQVDQFTAPGLADRASNFSAPAKTMDSTSSSFARFKNNDNQKSSEKDLVKDKIKDESGKKVGRNDPCPCGSGKKFKKCCGR